MDFRFFNSVPLNGNSFSSSDSNHHALGQRQVNGGRFNRDLQLINGDVGDLTKQKEELVIRLTKQLVALTNDRTTITDQNTTNDLLGTDISSIVAQKVRPSEASKFRSHVDDVGHITMLLLSLSGRLARTENSIFSTTDVTEKVMKTFDHVISFDRSRRSIIRVYFNWKIINLIYRKR